MGSRMVGFRVPEDIYEEIERVSGERGMTTADYLRKLVDDSLYPPSGNKAAMAIEQPVMERLGNVERQLNELRAKLNDLGDVKELAEIANALTETEREHLNELDKEIKRIEQEAKNRHSELRAEWQRVHKATIDQVDKNMTAIEKEFDEVKGNIARIEIKQANHTHADLITKGEQAISELKGEVERAKKLAIRKPTDDFEELKLSDGSKHTFRVYRGKRGLSKPHRISIDPISGDKYIDLAEPED